MSDLSRLIKKISIMADQQNLPTTCGFLISFLDNVRNAWLARLKEVLTDEGIEVVNGELDLESDVTVEMEDATPELFVFGYW